jgi:hypothetical protein
VDEARIEDLNWNGHVDGASLDLKVPVPQQRHSSQVHSRPIGVLSLDPASAAAILGISFSANRPYILSMLETNHGDGGGFALLKWGFGVTPS